jgi:hypothetical protein
MKQKNSLIDRIPNNPSALLFLMLAVVGSALLFISPIRILALLLGTLVSFVLTSISPALPYDYHQIEFYRGRWSIFWITFVMTLFFCLIANASFSLYADTLFGDDPSRLYFLKDWHNVIQYTFVVPVYVGLEVCLISIALYSWPQLRRLANEASSSGRPKVKVPRSIRLYRSRTLNKAALWFSYNANRLRFSGFIFLSLSITGILISTFINDALNPERVATTYWFVRQLDEKHRLDTERPGNRRIIVETQPQSHQRPSTAGSPVGHPRLAACNRRSGPGGGTRRLHHDHPVRGNPGAGALLSQGS